MGGGLAAQALEKGWKVAGYSKGRPAVELFELGLKSASSLAELVASLARPRIILLYIPAGAAIDDVLETLCGVMEADDIIADGGNSYWGDSVRRHQRMKKYRVHFVDLGTSGGVSGARRGACFMAGGEDRAVRRLEPLLKDLSVPGGFVHAGPPGAGHFAKLVHNGIEFGMLQAIGEGVDLLSRWPAGGLPIREILGCWRHGSVIRSWLIDLMHEAYTKEGGLDRVPPFVEDTGEVTWLVGDAMRWEIPIPVIAHSVIELMRSRDRVCRAPRAVALMRRGFGGHPLGRAPAVARERRTSRVSEEVVWNPSDGDFGPSPRGISLRKAPVPRRR